MRILASTALCALLLTGCGANHNSIYRTHEFDPGAGYGSSKDPVTNIAMIDAKQRAIISNYVPARKRKDKEDIPAGIRVCAEAGADAFSVLSSSVAASGTLSKGDTEAAANLATSVNEIGTTIGLRTQTVQVLRDIMYRTCERYMGGAIGPEEFEIQNARDQRTIVSLLAIEQLTGAVTPKPVTIAATAQAETGATLLSIQANRDQAQEDLEEQTEIAAASKQALVDNQDETADKDLKAKADKDEARRKDLEENLANLHIRREVALTASTASTAGATATEISADNYTSNIDQHTAEKLAQAVTDIVTLTFNIDEVMMKCIKILSDNDAKKPVQSFCLGYLNNKNIEKAKALGAEAIAAMKTLNEDFGSW